MLEDLKSLIWQRAQNRKTTGHTQVRKTRESAETPFYRPLTFRNVGVVGSNPIISTTKHQVRMQILAFLFCVTNMVTNIFPTKLGLAPGNARSTPGGAVPTAQNAD